jgi:hypothetical protein
MSRHLLCGWVEFEIVKLDLFYIYCTAHNMYVERNTILICFRHTTYMQLEITSAFGCFFRGGLWMHSMVELCSTKKQTLARAAWCSVHRLRSRNRRSWVRIWPGYKVFGTLQCCSLQINLHCCCVYLGEINVRYIFT